MSSNNLNDIVIISDMASSSFSSSSPLNIISSSSGSSSNSNSNSSINVSTPALTTETLSTSSSSTSIGIGNYYMNIGKANADADIDGNIGNINIGNSTKPSSASISQSFDVDLGTIETDPFHTNLDVESINGKRQMYVNVGQMNGRVGVHMSQPKSMPDLKHDQRGVDYSTNGIVYKQPMDDIDHHQMIERMFTFINNNQENERTNESNNNRQQVILSSLPLSSSSLSSNQMMDGNSNKKMTNESGDSVMKLNPVGPTEFLERYRVRNSSQRPLVNGSFTDSSKTINQEENNNNNNPHHHHKKSAALPINAKMIMIDHESIKCKEDVMEKKSSNNNNNNNNNELEEIPERGQWSGQLDFIFSCISYAVGLGNVWRFPYLCYENGGGAFLVPYLLCVCVLGVPLFLMEVSLGQYLQAGGVSVWNKIPILKGIGFASMVMIGLCNTYYIVIIAWTLYYLFNSFKSPLPWASCDNWWNSAECHQSDAIHNSSTGTIPPSQEFWNLNVLGISNDLAEVGHIQWHLFATLILAWIMVYLVIYRGIHQSGKIIWFTAMFPYVILFILFGYGLTLSGASEGIMFYITPQWNKLTEAKIWVAAGTQLLFTYGIGIGTNIALGSYNSFNHNFLRDSLIACLLSSATSLFSGFVIFSVLGHLAQSLNTTVAEVARSGPGLTFIVYPEALTRLPISNLWAILFFVMLLVLGIDSQFCTVESFVTGIVDEYPRLLRPHRKLFTAFVVLIHFILGISMITQGGMYVFQLMDNFSASGISLMIVVLMEIVGFCWIYGGENVYHNMCKMLGYKPTRLLLYFWQYISPLLLLGILIFSIVKYDAPEYAGRPFPWYGQVFGWIISSASIACIPCYVLYYLFFKSDRNLTIMQRIVIGLSDNNSEASSTTEEYSGAECDVDLEKASNRDLLDNESESAINFNHHNHHHHHQLTKDGLPIPLKHDENLNHQLHLQQPQQQPNQAALSGSNSTLSTSIADQSFNSSVQHISNPD